MQVKKINPDWFPSENRELKVGEIVEITNPEELIRKGMVQAVGVNGETISAYDLYGVMIPSEVEEFKTYMALQKEKATKEILEKQSKDLEAQLAEVKATVKEEVKEAPKATEEAPLYVAKKDR